ncbi:hypothetical protein G7047_10715 [Diaphorobacter sp. HDW4A]|uniref:hypothetical protein n=1 Tax=Diaphorobacter sp. HDW4A TaxID=2714924 RepID=UPI0014099A9B|nr:hypothetical protein [Diaphorobacter sp. HDW4A]QIL80323.1 hypothetical protein G7047_10715 [Diaphorobacter sp. HDW4A]
MNRTISTCLVVVGLQFGVAFSANAQGATATAATAQRKVQEAASAVASQDGSATRLSATETLSATIWGLSVDEMIRARVLLQGPRKSFSVENLSPIEALGIHARDESERRRYAEMFARAFHADVERSLAWNRAFTEAMARLYPDEPVVDFSRAPKVEASVGAADTLNVPRSRIVEKPPAATGTLPRRGSR